MNIARLFFAIGFLGHVASVQATPPNFVGESVAGYVQIDSVNGTNRMDGLMNVRFRPRVGSEIAHFEGLYVADRAVIFSGVNINEEQSLQFKCIVIKGQPLYEAAVQIAMNLTDGARLQVTRSDDSRYCATLRLSKGSRFQH